MLVLALLLRKQLLVVLVHLSMCERLQLEEGGYGRVVDSKEIKKYAFSSCSDCLRPEFFSCLWRMSLTASLLL